MANYFVISRAKPKPGYAATGLKHLKTLADFTKDNGAVHCDCLLYTSPSPRDNR